MNKEKLIEEIIRECEKDGEPVTREEAAEMAEMELKAKKDCRRYEGDTTTKKRPKKEKKLDEEKVEIIKVLAFFLSKYKRITEKETIIITNVQKEIIFSIGENHYSVTLTKHRNKSGEK